MSKWITEITLNNFRAFGKPETIKIPKGSHLLIYGENGSGKSSIYNALKDFFSSADATNGTKFKLNLFEKAASNNAGNITIKVVEDGQQPKEFKFAEPDAGSDHRQNEIILANKFKGFLDYKRMLRVHSIEIPDGKTPNLFELIAKELLKEHRVANPKGGTTTVEFLKEYNDIVNVLQNTESNYAELTEGEIDEKNSEIEEELEQLAEEAQQEKDLPERIITRRLELNDEKEKYAKAKHIVTALDHLKKLNTEYETLLGNIENIANDYLHLYFKNKIQIKVLYRKLEFNPKTDEMAENISLKILYAGKEIEFYQAFLNEARLSALAISIYLASIKTFNPTQDSLKVLYLDDVFIGLDTSNHFPLLEIIKDKFAADGFQLFISTYDREWFELSRHWFQTKLAGKISCLELFIEDDGNPNTPDNPVIIPYENNLARANAHFKSKDYPAAGNYLRKECEAIIKKYLPDTLKIDDNGKTIDELEPLMKKLEELFEISDLSKPQELLDAIKIYRKALLNPTSHSDIKSSLFKKEIDEAFEIVNKLNSLPVLKRTLAFNKGDVFRYENVGSSYSIELELADNIFVTEQAGTKTLSKHRFRIRSWTRNAVEWATDANGTLLPVADRANVCEQARTLEEVFQGINLSTGIIIPGNILAEIKIGATGTLNDLIL